MSKLRAVPLFTFALLFSAGAWSQSAIEQLQNATSGNQTTSGTFDGSRNQQTIDTRPSGGNTTIQTPPGVDRSSGTAGGYGTSTSSGTASGNASRPIRSGVESSGGAKPKK